MANENEKESSGMTTTAVIGGVALIGVLAFVAYNASKANAPSADSVANAREAGYQFGQQNCGQNYIGQSVASINNSVNALPAVIEGQGKDAIIWQQQQMISACQNDKIMEKLNCQGARINELSHDVRATWCPPRQRVCGGEA